MAHENGEIRFRSTCPLTVDDVHALSVRPLGAAGCCSARFLATTENDQQPAWLGNFVLSEERSHEVVSEYFGSVIQLL